MMLNENEITSPAQDHRTCVGLMRREKTRALLMKSDEAVVDAEVRKFDDPAARICTGTRLYVRTACKYPLWGMFLARVGSRHTVREKLLDRYLCRDISLTENSQANHVEDMMYLVLTGLDIRKQEAHDIAYMPLPVPGPVIGPVFQTLSLAAGRSAKAST